MDIAGTVLLGVLTLVALAPLLLTVPRDAPVLVQIVPLACGFVIGRMFRSAMDDDHAWWTYLAAILLAGLAWLVFWQWSRAASRGADPER